MIAMPPGDMSSDLTGEFAAVGQHVAAKQVDPHALEAALLFAERKNFEETFCSRRHARTPFSLPLLAAREIDSVA